MKDEPQSLVQRPVEEGKLDVLTNRAPLVPGVPSEGARAVALYDPADPTGPDRTGDRSLPGYAPVSQMPDYLLAVSTEADRMASTRARRRFTAEDLDKELAR